MLTMDEVPFIERSTASKPLVCAAGVCTTPPADESEEGLKLVPGVTVVAPTRAVRGVVIGRLDAYSG